MVVIRFLTFLEPLDKVDLLFFFFSLRDFIKFESFKPLSERSVAIFEYLKNNHFQRTHTRKPDRLSDAYKAYKAWSGTVELLDSRNL